MLVRIDMYDSPSPPLFFSLYGLNRRTRAEGVEMSLRRQRTRGVDAPGGPGNDIVPTARRLFLLFGNSLSLEGGAFSFLSAPHFSFFFLEGALFLETRTATDSHG